MAKNERSMSSIDDEIVLFVVLGLIVALLLYWQFDKLAFAWKYLRTAQSVLIFWVPTDWYQNGLAFLHSPFTVIATKKWFMVLYDYTVNLPVVIAEAAILVLLSRLLRRRLHHHIRVLSLPDILEMMSRANPHIRRFIHFDPVAERKPLAYKRGHDNTYAVPLDWYEFVLIAPPLGLESQYKGMKNPPSIVSGYNKDQNGLYSNGVFDRELARLSFSAQFGRVLCEESQLKECEIRLQDEIKKYVFKYQKRYWERSPDHDRLRSQPEQAAFLEHHARKAWDKIVSDCRKRHAYVYTYFMGLLHEAKNLGTIENNVFDWLKPFDRSLNLCINAVGSGAPPVEVAGPFSHFEFEVRLNRAVSVKLVDLAVRDLEEMCSNIKLLCNYEPPNPHDPAFVRAPSFGGSAEHAGM